MSNLGEDHSKVAGAKRKIRDLLANNSLAYMERLNTEAELLC